jgi:hypothetical protein
MGLRRAQMIGLHRRGSWRTMQVDRQLSLMLLVPVW